MPPRKVVLLRHAEKPDCPGDPHLDTRGRARAELLVTVIPRLFPNVTHLFAAKTSHESSRPMETLEPLSARLGLKICDKFDNEQFAHLATWILEEPKFDGSSILVCWHHGELPSLARCFGVTPPQDPWPADDFDRMWQITFSESTAPSILELKEA